MDASRVLRMRSVSASIASAARVSASRRPLAVSSLITTATASMMAKVTRYCASFTVNVPCGGTNMKSNAATQSTALRIAGPRLKRRATTTTASR